MKARIVRRKGDGWLGIPIAGYAPEQPGNVERHTIVGERRTDESAPGPKLELRYFRLAAGGASRLEKHDHEHYVIVGEGRGKVYVDGEVSDLEQHDVVYVAPMQPHQFVNSADEPFGFYCIVSTVRDFYSELSEDEHQAIAKHPGTDFVQPDAQRAPR
jgi:quercetin dioxygenase-like cupin family protein